MLEKEYAIQVTDVTKYFKVYEDPRITWKDKLLSKGPNTYEKRVVLKGLSFAVKRGEAVGIIGKNGCGKSTTLKLLSKIIAPNSGAVSVNGRVSSLLELGAGFHPELSGLENIYLNASIFGLTKREIQGRIQEIIDFSELREYIYQPVRTYSSGMYMRLAFSVAIHVDAEVLLIDEILAVGDIGFQKKCFQRLLEIKKRGTTIVLVSHSLDQIERLCQRTLWLDQGVIRMDGEPKAVHQAYYQEVLRDSAEEDRSMEASKPLEETRLGDPGERLASMEALLKQKNQALLEIQSLCNHFATGKLMRLNHLLFRIKGQLLGGKGEDRSKFWKWLFGSLRKTNQSLMEGEKYNPWMLVGKKAGDAIMLETQLLEEQSQGLSRVTLDCLSRPYEKMDVIVLSVIDYQFRYQRPQHFAAAFAAQGHRVFYINANFVRPKQVKQEQENLYLVDLYNSQCSNIYDFQGEVQLQWLKDSLDAVFLQYAVRDAVVIVDYPNWIEAAEYLKAKYGFGIVTDYMDDYTGFLNTASKALKENCERLLKISDRVVTSSQFLYQIAMQYTYPERLGIVRNGTQVSHFVEAYQEKQRPERRRKVIGYYGAVSHWFDIEKLCAVAEAFPDCQVALIGEVAEKAYLRRLKAFPNIQLLGEKPYQELPGYLAEFDVCLIPFDTSTNLIQATNPVKFYEYLSAGKKIVATEIPELKPFEDTYVYLANDTEEFVRKVGLCLEGRDTLCEPEQCLAFARENDWQKRFRDFEKHCVEAFPKVSIVVLSYNQAAYTRQCVESIWEHTAYPNYELIVVDNHSQDGTRAYLEEQLRLGKPLRVLWNQENLGFAAGNNVGIREAAGEYVLLLNNDTVVTRGWLSGMVKHLQGHPELAMCNPVTNSIGNESKIPMHYQNLEELAVEAYEVTGKSLGQLWLQVDRLPLFGTLIRRQLLMEVGCLEEAYGIGMFEDDDLSECMRQLGYGLAIAEDSYIHHIDHGSFQKLKSQEYTELFQKNKAIFEQKWGRSWTMPQYRPGVTAQTNEKVRI